jgi:hypothetical protein
MATKKQAVAARNSDAFLAIAAQLLSHPEYEGAGTRKIKDSNAYAVVLYINRHTSGLPQDFLKKIPQEIKMGTRVVVPVIPHYVNPRVS